MGDDLAALEAQLAAATARDRVWLPRVLGRLERAAAVGEWPLDAGPAGWRVLPQVASPNHWAGRLGRAAPVQTEALPAADTAARGAATQQHTGERRFDQGDDTDAPIEFETARRGRPRPGPRGICASPPSGPRAGLANWPTGDDNRRP